MLKIVRAPAAALHASVRRKAVNDNCPDLSGSVRCEDRDQWRFDLAVQRELVGDTVP